ncbi:hypothetical protein [Haloechinothrix alba]|uniref:hypothetical protein n=1 Tax=Haloechinothrix alba TaxID=664784 RepID=UPI000B7856E8|nr:hypothetical protein [Haloechinothrix alba]
MDEPIPKLPENIFTAFLFLPLGAAIAVALRRILKGKGPILLYCLIGGVFAASFEPIVDVLGLVYLKEINAFSTFTILDRTMPLYIVMVYPWYVGGLGYVAYKMYSRGVTMRDLFILWAIDAVINVCLETPGILMGVYLYYGQQPLNIWGLPLWWPIVNPLMPMIAGAVIYKLRPFLNTNWKLLAVIPVVPMADGAANGAAAWPIWAALNQDDVSYVWTHLAAAATLGLALFTVWIIGLAVAKKPEEIGNESLMRRMGSIGLMSSPDTPVATGPGGATKIGA